MSKIQSVGEGSGGWGVLAVSLLRCVGKGREEGYRHYGDVRLAGQCEDGVGGAEDVIGPWDKETAK